MIKLQYHTAVYNNVLLTAFNWSESFYKQRFLFKVFNVFLRKTQFLNFVIFVIYGLKCFEDQPSVYVIVYVCIRFVHKILGDIIQVNVVSSSTYKCTAVKRYDAYLPVLVCHMQ